MIELARQTRRSDVQRAARHKPAGLTREQAEKFAELLPRIVNVASYTYRRVPRGRREELLADVTAKAFVAFAELVRQGREALIYPSALAKFAIRQVAAGRQVGQRLNGKEVLAPHAQRMRGFSVRSLARQKFDGTWEELVVEDGRATPADVAAVRLDFQAWLAQLDRFQRSLALRLAVGERTCEAAERLGVSRPRICQLRACREPPHEADAILSSGWRVRCASRDLRHGGGRRGR